MEMCISLYKFLQTIYHRTLVAVILHSPVDSTNFSLDEEIKISEFYHFIFWKLYFLPLTTS